MRISTCRSAPSSARSAAAKAASRTPPASSRTCSCTASSRSVDPDPIGAIVPIGSKLPQPLACHGPIRKRGEGLMPIPVAVLIDGENISNKLLEPLKPLVEAIGIVSSWQLFGDFYTWPHPGWHEVANANGIEIRHQF